MHRNQLHFSTPTTRQKKEIKESIPFTIAPKTIRYLGINLTKETQNVYSENYKVLINEIEDDTKKWKNVPCSWIGKQIDF